MRAIVRLLLLVPACWLLAGCASIPYGPGDETTFTADLGRVAYDPLVRAVDEVVEGEYGYPVAEREEQYARVYYETGWIEGAPAPAEAKAGVTDARRRIIFRGQRFEGTFRVTFHGERRIRTEDRREWHRAPLPEPFRRRMSEIVARLEAALGSEGAANGFWGERRVGG